MTAARKILAKGGLAGKILLLLFSASLVGEFLVPYGYNDVRFDLSYAPAIFPEMTTSGIIVPVLEQVDPVTRSYRPVPGKAARVHFFCRGDRYHLFGIFPSDRHLVCADSPGRISFLGSDALGRDLFSRLVIGMRLSFLLSLFGVAISFLFGVTAGLVSGYWGGWIDSVIMRTGEVFMAIPSLYLLMGFRALFPPGIPSGEAALVITGALALVGWAGLARVIRGVTMSLVREDYILAARASGATPREIFINHLLPNMSPYLVVAVTLSVPGFIVGEAGLSFLGLGIAPPHPSLGNMLADAQSLTVMRTAPWLLVSGFLVVLLVLLFNRLGDHIREND
jgi:peptide/nickel transport system permease protein